MPPVSHLPHRGMAVVYAVLRLFCIPGGIRCGETGIVARRSESGSDLSGMVFDWQQPDTGLYIISKSLASICRRRIGPKRKDLS